MYSLKLNKVLSFATVILLLFAFNSYAKDLYVNNLQKNQGDGSFSNPYSHIQQALNSAQPGDTIYVRGNSKGQVYTENIYFPISGTADAPITLKTYKNEKVIISFSDSIRFDKNYWILEGFILDHQNAQSDAIKIRGGNHNIIRYNEIRNGQRDGIDIGSGDNNIIENNIIHDFIYPYNDAHGIVIDDGNNNVFRNNTIYNFSGDGIQIIHGTASGTIIEGNHIYSTGCGENAVDIKSTKNVIIRNNVFHGFRRSPGNPLCRGTGSDGVAIVIHHDVDTVLIEKNEIYDSEGGFRATHGSRTYPPRNITFRRNIIHDLFHESSSKTTGYGVQFDGIADIKFYNNTFVNIPGPLFWVAGYNYPGGVKNWDLRNNLFYNCGNNFFDHTTQSELKGIFDYNGWFKAQPLYNEIHSVIGIDPMMMDINNGNFRLTASSPAIDAGSPEPLIPSDTDFDGITVPVDGNADGISIVDLGAFEYNNSNIDKIAPSPPENLKILK